MKIIFSLNSEFKIRNVANTPDIALTAPLRYKIYNLLLIIACRSKTDTKISAMQAPNIEKIEYFKFIDPRWNRVGNEIRTKKINTTENIIKMPRVCNITFWAFEFKFINLNWIPWLLVMICEKKEKNNIDESTRAYTPIK